MCAHVTVCVVGTQQLCASALPLSPVLLPKPLDSWAGVILTQLFLCSVGWATSQMLLEKRVC